jgi:TonB family protein
LQGTVGPNGQITNLKVIEGDKDLAAAAVGAISKWRFYAAKKKGKHIEEPVHINVVFRLDGEQVHVQVFNLAGEPK